MTTDTIRIIDDGLFRDMPAVRYHAVDAMSNSRMTMLARSPLYCKWRMENPMEQTPEMALGSLLHTSLLEPQNINELYAEMPKCDRRTTAGKSLYQAAMEAAAGKMLVSTEDMDKAQAMVRAVLRHPYARAILEARIETELSGVWVDEATGLRCKFRADAISKPRGAEFPTLVDIKTTRSIEPDKFARSMKTYGYFRQMPFYLMGLTELDLYCEDCAIIAVETAEPYEVAVFRPSAEDLLLGRRHALALMKKYARCLETNHWPDRNNGRISEVGLSTWQRADVENDIKTLEAR